METIGVSSQVIDASKSVRFRKPSPKPTALILKIDASLLQVITDTLMEDTTLEDVVEALPDATPRFLIISFQLNHDDGRQSYPLIGIYYSPESTSDKNRMMYASAKNRLFQLADISKVFSISDAEELTDEYLKNLKIK